MSLVPAESPSLNYERLAAPARTIDLGAATRRGPLLGANLLQWGRRGGALLGFFAVLSGLIVLAAQPRLPGLNSQARATLASGLVAMPEESLAAIPSPTPAADTNLADAAIAAVATGNTAAIQTVASQPVSSDYTYQLALAQSSLSQAIALSKDTAASQQEQDRQNILGLLDQAVQAANQAITIDNRQGVGFLLRARIYKTASVIRPDLATYVDSDLEAARTLGIDQALLAAAQQSPLDLIPTQQANNLAAAPAIAAPGSDAGAVVGGEATSNARSGDITLPAGWETLFVSLPDIADSTQVQIAPANGATDPFGRSFSVLSKEAGRGFTIRASAPGDEDVALTWWLVE